MVANRTSKTSKTPGFRSVTLSSSANRVKPGKRLANSTTSRMAGRKRSEKSWSNCCWPLDGAGVGFNGQAYYREKKENGGTVSQPKGKKTNITAADVAAQRH